MTQPTAVPTVSKSTARPSGMRMILAQAVRLADTCSPARIKDRAGRIARYLCVQWPWTLVVLMYAAASYMPLAWAWTPWTQPYSVEAFQIWVPLAVVIVGWGRREQVQAAWTRAQSKRLMMRVSSYEAGNVLPLLVGCTTLLFVHLVQVKGYGVIALILIAWGVLYQAYGMKVMRTLRVPLLLFPLMIPLPDSVVDKAGAFVRQLVVNGLCTVLNALHRPAVTDGSNIRFLNNNFVANLSPTGGGIDIGIGLDVSLMASLAVATYCLYKNRMGGQIVVSVATAFGLGLVLNFARLLVVALVAERFPSFAFALSGYNTYLFAAVVYVLTLPVAYGIIIGFRHVFVTPPSGTRRRVSPFQLFLTRLGKVVGLPFYPILVALGLAGRGANRVSSYARRGTDRTARAMKAFDPALRVLMFPAVMVTRLLKRTEKGLEWLMSRPMSFIRRGGRNRNFRRPDRFR